MELLSDPGYSVPLTQNAALSTYTTYYVQVTHPSLSSVSGGTNGLTLRNMTQGSVNFGDGASTKSFTQSGSGPYMYRSSFVTPSSANTYSLEIQLQNSGNSQRAVIRGWKLIVGSTSNYVRTYSDRAMTVEADSFSPGATVYVKTYNGSSGYSNHNPSTGDSSVIFNSFGQSSNTTLSMFSTSQSNRTYTCSFKVPANASGDKWVRTTIMSDSPYPRPEFLLHIIPPDTEAPVVSNVMPSGTIDTDSPTISASYSDTGTGSGSFTVSICTAEEPVLSASTGSSFWGSFGDNLNGDLSVNLLVTNAGTSDAANVMITGSSDTNSVFMQNAPYGIGTVTAGGSVQVTLLYKVPPGIGSFISSLNASAEDLCGNTYTYP